MRPLLHFTPPRNWLNDPNGLVYYDGEYHLFYQHYPHSPQWGPMHWGHAVSRDLLSWTHLPIALTPDDNGMVFSGSAVVDWRNTAGFGAQALVAIYTNHKEPGHIETQCLAFSTDRGRTWQKYAHNPVLPNPNLRDFRDPKVFWHRNHWVMCLAAGQAIYFYTSPNLRHWTRAGVFAPQNILPADAVWETPDLFELPVSGSGQTRWVLTLGVSAGAPAGGSGACYFIGRFDGSTFIPDAPAQASALSDSPLSNLLPLWMDYGPDFYAPQSWNDAPNTRRICLGWMSNWQYARQVPTTGWRGLFSIPRELTLIQTSQGVRLAQHPLSELTTLKTHAFGAGLLQLTPGKTPLAGVSGACLLIEIELPRAGSGFCLRLHTGPQEQTTITCNLETNTLTLDRTRSGLADFHPRFAAVCTAPLPQQTDPIRLQIVIDHHTIEIFAADGVLALSALVFPHGQTTSLSIAPLRASQALHALDVYTLISPALIGV